MNNHVKITVHSVQGTCDAGLEIGDSFIIRNKGCMVLEGAEGLCVELLNSIIPQCMVYTAGGSFPWENDQGEIFVSCPDSKNLLTVKLTRI